MLVFGGVLILLICIFTCYNDNIFCVPGKPLMTLVLGWSFEFRPCLGIRIDPSKILVIRAPGIYG